MIYGIKPHIICDMPKPYMGLTLDGNRNGLVLLFGVEDQLFLCHVS
jgi:hypothetical protein